MFYGKEEVKFFLGCKDTKAYSVIREMANDLVERATADRHMEKYKNQFFVRNFCWIWSYVTENFVNISNG